MADDAAAEAPAAAPAPAEAAADAPAAAPAPDAGAPSSSSQPTLPVSVSAPAARTRMSPEDVRAAEEEDMRNMFKELKLGAQATYESHLMDEIVKLQEALDMEDQHVAERKAEVQQQVAAEKARRQGSSDRASRMAEMEAALQGANQEELRRIQERRANAEKRLAEREADSRRTRELEARKKEEQRMLAAEMHEETMKKAMAAQRRADEEKRKSDKAKNDALQARLDHERQLTAERNAKKAQDAAGKIAKAARLRTQQTSEARRLFNIRHTAQLQRMDTLRQVQEQKARDVKEQAKQKKEFIERTQAQMRAREAHKRQSTIDEETRKNDAMARRFDEVHRHRMSKQHEREVAQAASRGRVERTMSDLEAKLANHEAEQNERLRRLNHFDNLRQTRYEQQARLAVVGSIEKQHLGNQMDRMRQNMKNTTSAFRIPAHFRSMLMTAELRAIVERADPAGTGVISQADMRRVLSELGSGETSPLASLKRIKSSRHAQSLPALTSVPSAAAAPAAADGTAKERLFAAFRAADTDGSGELSKRELYKVLEDARLGGVSEDLLRLFEGFDVNHDGKLSFEEFARMAEGLR